MDDLISVQSNFIRDDLGVNYYSNIIFDFVYTLESGVDIKALVDFFGEKIYEDIFISVSYTHLDVYKRQRMYTHCMHHTTLL